MPASPPIVERPQRWDAAFDPNMTDEDVNRLLFTAPFRKSEIAANKFPANHQPGIGGKDHIGELFSRRNEFHFATQGLQSALELRPLCAGKRRQSIMGAIHPRVDLVFDSVVFGWTEQQLLHR